VTIEAILALALFGWFVIVPLAVVSLRLRRVRFAESLAPLAAAVRALPRACEARHRLALSARAPRRTARPL